MTVTNHKGKFMREPQTCTNNILETASTNVHEVFEARKLIEIEMAALAAYRATRKDLKNIETKLPLLVESKESHEAHAAEISFHRAWIAAAHNSVLSEIQNTCEWDLRFLFRRIHL